MGTTYIGSARIGENGKATGGKVGDQKQTTSPDYKGEVSMQTLASFVKGRKLYILRPKQCVHAQKIAEGMKIACNNINLGYSQSCSRYMPDDINSKIKINVDCSKLIRDVVYYATGIDVGNFTTANEVSVLVNSGLFDRPIVYTANTKVYEGDVFVTQTKGHTGACADGLSREITKTVKPDVAKPTIKKGSTGEQAKWLQRDLNVVINANLVIDGIFGTKSVDALKKWQKQYGLTVDGIYGNKSYAKMKQLIG